MGALSVMVHLCRQSQSFWQGWSSRSALFATLAGLLCHAICGVASWVCQGTLGVAACGPSKHACRALCCHNPEWGAEVSAGFCRHRLDAMRAARIRSNPSEELALMAEARAVAALAAPAAAANGSHDEAAAPGPAHGQGQPAAEPGGAPEAGSVGGARAGDGAAAPGVSASVGGGGRRGGCGRGSKG